jgi:hypothetical protein
VLRNKVKISGEPFEFVDQPRNEDVSETPVEDEVQLDSCRK